jgi:hypothetical protein
VEDLSAKELGLRQRSNNIWSAAVRVRNAFPDELYGAASAVQESALSTKVDRQNLEKF